MKLSFRKELQVASVRSEENWNKVKVHSLLQSYKKRLLTFDSYISQNFNNSVDSITQIVSSAQKSKFNLNDHLLEIADTVDSQKKIRINILLEDVPYFTLIRMSNILPVNSIFIGDLRYSVLDNPSFSQIPKEICDDNDVRKGYERIMLKQLKDYKELKALTNEAFKKHYQVNEKNKSDFVAWKKRVFEISKYLLPMGINSRSSVFCNAFNLGELLSYLASSDSLVEDEIYELIYELFVKENETNEDQGMPFLKEINMGSNCRDINLKILNILKENLSSKQKRFSYNGNIDSFSLKYCSDPTEELLSHYEFLLNPLGSSQELEISDDMQKSLGEIIFSENGGANSLGCISNIDAIGLTGFASLDLISSLVSSGLMKSFVPILTDEIDLEQELLRKNNQCFFLPQILNISEFKKLKKKYERSLLELYEQIRKWRALAKKVLTKEIIDEYTKYLLPRAHSTKYFFYASIDNLQYTINKKVGVSNSFEESLLMYECLRLLSLKDSIWNPLLKRVIKPNINDVDQFLEKEYFN